MTDSVRWSSPGVQQRRTERSPQQSGTDLADILERVLDKGIVIAGDIQVNLLDIELLTIKIRLVVASVDRAKEMGIDWWERDPTLSGGRSELEEENARLRDRLERLLPADGADGPAAEEDDGRRRAAVERSIDEVLAGAGDEPGDDRPEDGYGHPDDEPGDGHPDDGHPDDGHPGEGPDDGRTGDGRTAAPRRRRASRTGRGEGRPWT